MKRELKEIIVSFQL